MNLIVVFVLLLYIIFSSYFLILKEENSSKKILNETLPLIQTVDDLWTNVLNEETSVRGYVLTSEAKHLAPYYNARKAISRDMEKLDQYEKKYSTVDTNIEKLFHPQMKKIDNFFQTEIQLVQQGKTAEAETNINNGKKQMDQLRILNSQLQNTLLNISRDESNARAKSLAIAKTVIFIAVLASIVIAIFVSFLFYRARKAENQLNYLAFFDSLTGIPNRASLKNYFARELDSFKRKKQNLAVLFVDLDGFKQINDAKGHSFGDLYIQKAVEKMNSILTANGRLFRFGGDEFIVLLEDYKDVVEVTQLAKHINAAFAEPIQIDGFISHTSVSIGISLFPNNGSNGEKLVQYADLAMYDVKKNGKGGFCFYNTRFSIELAEKVLLEEQLREAIREKSFILHYQPQIDLSSGAIEGLEALIRWEHPDRGIISPIHFIPLAEETGLIIPLGKWVMEEACRQNQAWQASGFPPVQIGVNVSPVQFQDTSFLETVQEVLRETGMDPRYLVLEITENVMQNTNEVMDIIRQLKQMGIKVSIDDFGTGFSSLSYLHRLPIDQLKIDKSFVDGIYTNSASKSLITSIIDMGQNLELQIVAEGIEDKHQERFLQEKKCNIGQGYLYSKPLHATEIESLMGEKMVPETRVHI
ncbi:EAL domain-containing protein [Neobacillus sp. SM06]|uniref:EAL domain-containing protein n=1 Tax=Neobacillus sp. SM06 TaxID=3422492 RepID=UPI003D2DA168